MSATADNPLLPYNMAYFPAKNVATIPKNWSILYGKSKISVIVNNLLYFYNMAQFITRFVHTKSETLLIS